MDKIREEFENILNIESPKNERHIIEGYDFYKDDELQKRFDDFTIGCKSRNEEIKRLRYLINPDAPDKYFNDLLDNISKQELQAEIKKLQEGLQTIIDLGFDNDEFEKSHQLKGLIAELIQIAKKTLEGKFCHMCHGYGWNIVNKETGEARFCPVCNKQALKENE